MTMCCKWLLLQQLIVAADPPPRQLGKRSTGQPSRPHYSADWQSGIAPRQFFLYGKHTPYIPTTPANLNKTKGHGNPVPDNFDFLSQRIKR
jgi:hypothetical protein